MWLLLYTQYIFDTFFLFLLFRIIRKIKYVHFLAVYICLPLVVSSNLLFFIFKMLWGQVNRVECLYNIGKKVVFIEYIICDISFPLYLSQRKYFTLVFWNVSSQDFIKNKISHVNIFRNWGKYISFH